MPQLDVLANIPLPAALRSFIESAAMPGLGAMGRKVPASDPLPTDALLDQLHLRGTLAEAALWLLVNELDMSHCVSQSDESAEGSFWHGIMHRREGDFGNAKYWFRRVGKHPVHTALAATIAARSNQDSSGGLPSEKWSELTRVATLPASLVDMVEQALQDKSEWIDDLETVAWWEWQLLFQYCWIASAEL